MQITTETLPDEIVTSRLIAAAPSLVFKAYHDASHLAHWWGPQGFTNTIHEFRFHPGGAWRLDMRGPDGSVYPNEWVFEETTPERIAIRHLEPGHGFLLTMSLDAEDGLTRLTWRVSFETAAQREAVELHMTGCNEENFDRLEAELARMTAMKADPRELVISRLIDAPRAKVYQAWTQPELLKQWFRPPPYVTTAAHLDLRPGGMCLVTMRGPDGIDLPNPGVYLEVEENERLVLTDAYTEAWRPAEKPFMTTVLTFADEDGKTRYTARAIHWSLADREAHEAMGFHEGWGIATDQLAALCMK